MKRFLSTLLIVILALSLGAALISCKDSEGEDTPEVKKISVVSADTEGAIKFVGYVGDVEFAHRSGIRFMFGEDAKYAATSDEDGMFTFYYADPDSVGKTKALDYLSLESEDYDYRAFISEPLDTFDQTGCTVVIAEKEKEFDMSKVVANYGMRAAFSQYNQILPEEYYLYNEKVENNKPAITKENDGMDKVKLFVNDELYLRSTRGHMFIPYMIAGTEIRLEYDQFKFGIRKAQQQGDITILDDPTYVITEEDLSLYIEFRGFPIDITDDDNWDTEALIKCTTWQE